MGWHLIFRIMYVYLYIIQIFSYSTLKAERTYLPTHNSIIFFILNNNENFLPITKLLFICFDSSISTMLFIVQYNYVNIKSYFNFKYFSHVFRSVFSFLSYLPICRGTEMHASMIRYNTPGARRSYDVSPVLAWRVVVRPGLKSHRRTWEQARDINAQVWSNTCNEQSYAIKWVGGRM